MENTDQNCPKCPFFSVCAAGIIRERRGENWYKKYCYCNFEDCVHFKDRNKLSNHKNIPKEENKTHSPNN